MFDARTAALLQSAPSFKHLDAQDLPRILTQQYAELVAARLSGSEPESVVRAHEWTLDRIADTYEIVTSIENNNELRRAAAFVAGTAQQIRARGVAKDLKSASVLTRDGVDGRLTAALLFLIAEQYADASEAAHEIPEEAKLLEFRILALHIKDLARGRIKQILERAENWREENSAAKRKTIRFQALQALGSALCDGVELMAADLLSVEHPAPEEIPFSTAAEVFRKVLDACSHVSRSSEQELSSVTTLYAGPAHLASLLLAAGDSLNSAALTKLPPPEGIDNSFWHRWLTYRANETPYVWQNHREAITKGFYEPGTSAVLVLPTGAGKTTVSSLKIAAALASRKKVIFLAPTHALVEQLTDDLQSIFPKEEFRLDVSSEFDSVLMPESSLQDIEVMTPERCLTMLSFSPKSFENVGLLVFDECHLLSPQDGKNRRALESMLCVLTLNNVAPKADMLFLSAMLRNGQEFAQWIGDLTGRDCVAVDLLWKPSRQARGVVVYERTELQTAEFRAWAVQHSANIAKGKEAQSVRMDAKRQLRAKPHAVWGLQHNWLTQGRQAYFTTSILQRTVELSGKLSGNNIHITPNANQVSGQLAAAAARHGLKTIIFVNTKNDAVGVAEDVASWLADEVPLNKEETAIWNAIGTEFGSSSHSVFYRKHFSAVPHNSAMLRIERLLSEKLYRRNNGATVIVATPTLAQGLNLPAQLAILAGDKRMGESAGERVTMDAHELLNAAARAGRAGHLANGAVLLVPDPVCSFERGRRLEEKVKRKLQSILPEDDRCIDITDPLQIVLDRVMQGDVVEREVRYTVNRLAALANAEESGDPQTTLLSRSLGAYIAKKRGEEREYTRKIDRLWEEVKDAASNNTSKEVILLASQSGLPLDLLDRLRQRIIKGQESLPSSVKEWINWALRWLAQDDDARNELLGEIRDAVLSATGRRTKDDLDRSAVMALKDGILAWVFGSPINLIEEKLGGDPNSSADTRRLCPRARTLITTVIPRGLSFTFSVIVRMIEELGILQERENIDEKTLKALPSAVRRGFDTVQKLEFANQQKSILSRVQIHLAYDQMVRPML